MPLPPLTACAAPPGHAGVDSLTLFSFAIRPPQLYIPRMMRTLLATLSLLILAAGAEAGEPAKKKLLLLWQGPDGHPPQTHEYEAGQKTLAKLLEKTPGLDVSLVRVDEPWRDGPEVLAKADGIVIFVSEGAKWTQADPKRAAALADLAKRKGGIS